MQIQKNIQIPSKKIHPIEEALINLRDHGEIGDSILLPKEMATGARIYYSRVATDTKVFRVAAEGTEGAVRVWLAKAQARPQAPVIVADPVSLISPK